jgi:hypothetical protein
VGAVIIESSGVICASDVVSVESSADPVPYTGTLTGIRWSCFCGRTICHSAVDGTPTVGPSVQFARR